MAVPGFRDRDHALRTAQILSIALVLSVLFFVVVAIFLAEFGNIGPMNFDGILIVIAAGFAALMCIVSFVLTRSVPIPPNASEEELLNVFAGRNLLQKAPLEGAHF